MGPSVSPGQLGTLATSYSFDPKVNSCMVVQPRLSSFMMLCSTQCDFQDVPIWPAASVSFALYAYLLEQQVAGGRLSARIMSHQPRTSRST